MDPNELVTAYTVTDRGQADVIKVALENEGIPCELGGDGQAGFTGLWAIDLMVRAADVDRAKKIIETHE